MSRISRPALWTVVATSVLCLAPGAAGAALSSGHRAPAAGGRSVHLAVVHIEPDPDPAPVGGAVTVRGLVSNAGSEQTNLSLTVTVRLPEGVTGTGSYFPQTCQESDGARTISCTFPSGLHPSRTATVIIPAMIGTAAPSSGVLHGGLVKVASPEDPDAEHRTVEFDIRTS